MGRWRVLLGWLAALALLLAGNPTAAYAHAVLVRADPAPGSSLPHAPPRVTVWLSEPIIPAASRLEVYDMAGRRMDRGVTYYHGDPPFAMSVDLEPLPEGNYRVRWVTLSSFDGHYVVGTYPFAVGVAVSAPAGGEADIGSRLPAPGWVPVLLRYITLAGALGWGGIAFVHAFVVTPWLAARAGRLAFPAASLSHRYRRALSLSILLLLLGRALEVAWPTVATALAPVPVRWTIVTALLTNRFFLVSGGIIALAALALFLARRTIPAPALAGGAQETAFRPAPLRGAWPEPWSARAHGALAALALLGLAATGHAAAVSSPYYSSLMAAWLHYVAAAVWVGGLFYCALLLFPATAGGEIRERAQALVALLGGFTPYVLLAGFVLAVTGLLRAEVHLPDLSPAGLTAALGTTYGRALLVKVGLVGLMAGIGIIHSFRQRRRVRDLLARGADREEVRPPLRLWQRLLSLETGVALLLLLSVAVLTSSPPLRYGFTPLDTPLRKDGEPALARALLEQAERSMNALRSARVRERPGGSNSTGWTDYVLVAPSAMRIQTSGGDETVVWWNLMFTRKGGETQWQAGFWSPVYRFTWPNYVWTAIARQPTVLGREEVNGVPCTVVTFTDSTGTIRYTMWIGEGDGLVRREEVIAIGYHTVREYFDFNAPLEVTFPEDVRH